MNRCDLILLTLGIAFVTGVYLLIVARRFRMAWLTILAFVGGALCVLISGFYLIVAGPYLWALHLEPKWQQAHPTTMAQLESHLSLYSKHEIKPSDSIWGQNYKLQAGERMIQYRILWNAPLDVVCSRDNSIVTIYTSYE